MQTLLGQHPAAGVRVFAVWEPVRFADWQRPTTGALARLSDPRVTQFWDHDHILANQIEKDAAASHARPDCCEAKSILLRPSGQIVYRLQLSLMVQSSASLRTLKRCFPEIERR
jgi:hypothetical protein